MVEDNQVRDILTIAAASDGNDYVKLLARSALDAYNETSEIESTPIEDLNQ